MRKGAIRSLSMSGSMKKICMYDMQLTFYRISSTSSSNVYNKYRAELHAQYITPYIKQSIYYKLNKF